jgi:branched-chain amino acid transport system ATP-binding protein
LASRLIVNDIHAGYGASVRVLHGVSITVEAGETVVLLGSNGNGKSTLIKCITGIISPASGEIILEHDGERIDLVGKTPEQIVELGISLVPEGRRLFPKLSVEENLMLGAYRSAARREIDRNLKFCFETFPVLRERRKQLAGSMSGGEQQMVAVARAMMAEPKILLVDEPSVGLAPNLVSRMIAKIKELKDKRQLTVLMAEQNFNQAVKIADRGYIIVHGQIEFEGKSAAELSNNAMIKQYYLGV